MSLTIGTRIGEYEIKSPLGEGGMGVVFRAHDTKLGRDVALKALPDMFANNPEHLSRFRREAHVLASLNHPNIAHIYGFVDSDKTQCIVMELVRGRSLRALVADRMPVALVIKIGAQIAEALAAAHAAEIVHRDIKPENVMLRDDGYVKVLDFGIARFTAEAAFASSAATASSTQAGVIEGTVRYFSPEQAAGEKATTCSDIFSFGIVLYELFTGVHPFDAPSSLSMLHAIAFTQVARPSSLCPALPPAVDKMLVQMLAKDPRQRPLARQVASDLHDQLQAVNRSVNGSVTARHDSASPMTRLERSSVPSLAVLPFENLSRDPAEEYFTDGITDALITALASVSGLRVISRRSSIRYKGLDTPIKEIAASLNVNSLLEGTVFRAGTRVRITTRLIDALTDINLWSSTYEEDVTDVLALQGRVARAIAQELRVQLTQDEGDRLATSQPVNPETYAAYLRGRHYFLGFTAERVQQAITWFKKVAADDPASPLGHSGLAEAYVYLTTSAGVRSSEAIPEARAAASRALAIDPDAPQPHLVMAMIATYHDWDRAGAHREFERTIRLSPNWVDARVWYAWFLACLERRYGRALDELDIAERLDPLNLTLLTQRCFILHFARDFSRAEEQANKALDIEPNFALAHYCLGCMHSGRGELERAAQALEKAIELGGRQAYYIAVLGNFYGRLGRVDAARQLLTELDNRTSGYVSPSWFARVYVGLGELDRALDCLEAAYQERDASLIYVTGEPIMDPIREHPAFNALLEKMNVPLHGSA